jgi:DNA-binding transcriptional ArsR family regulator
VKLKLQLVRDGEIIFEVPLSPMDWSRKHLENEFKAIEGDFQRFSKVFDALAHETRLRMMKSLVEEEDRTMSFSDFMRDLNLNPKLVWENARKLKEGGLLEKIGRGRYRCSEFGESGFILISFALRRLKEALEELEEL